MNNIKKGWIIYRNHFPSVYKHWTVVVSILLMLLFTFFTSLEADKSIIYFFSLPILDTMADRNFAFQVVFFDFFTVIWTIICLGFVPVKILAPVVQSYTVSNLLWLKLGPTNRYDLTLYRVMLVIIPACVFGIVSVLWALLFSTVHQIPFSEIIYPVYSLLAFILFTGSISLCMSGKPTTLIEVRYAYIFVILVIPVLLFLLKSKIIYKLNGRYPFVFPYRADKLGFETLPGTITAIVIGVILILIITGVNYIRIISQKYQNQ